VKKIIIPLVTTIIIAILIFAGCAKPAPAPAPAPAELPGWGPMKGVAVKPDGSPYKFANLHLGLFNEWCVAAAELPESYAERAGGEMTTYISDMDSDRQIAQMEDLASVIHPDGILFCPTDPDLTCPAVESLGEAGFPIFNWEQRTPAEKVTMKIGHDQVTGGYVLGEWLVNYANDTGKELNVYELTGALGIPTSELRHQGFHEAVDGHPLITVVESPETGLADEGATTAITAYVPTHPEVNVIFSVGDMVAGVIESLGSIDRLYPAGDSNHVVFLSHDDDPAACDAMSKGYLDAATAHGPYESLDVSMKGLLTYVCLGKPVPKEVKLPIYLVTPENVDQSKFGSPKLWGLLPFDDFSQWPVLDIPPELIGGLVTPTAAMKSSQ